LDALFLIKGDKKMNTIGNQILKNLMVNKNNISHFQIVKRGYFLKHREIFSKIYSNRILMITVIFLFLNCSGADSQESKSETNLLKGIVVYQSNQLSEVNSTLFELNGSWKTFTEGISTSNTLTYIKYAATPGVWLDDSSGFGGYSSCKLIVQFNSTIGYIITQNPENNGACFTGDTRKGLYSKTIYKKSSTISNAYNYCESTFGKSTIAEAISADTSSVNISNLTTGCVSSFGATAWSRIEKR
jgi:hypothetical protein